MIQPTIGRVVWYHPTCPHTQPLAALVAYVHSDRMVNLAVFDANGVAYPAVSVTLVQDGDGIPPAGCSYCEWMPYQRGQAAKYDALAATKAGA